MSCPNPIDCDLNNITPEEVLRKLVQVDSSGCAALNTVVATPSGVTCDLFVDCTNKELDWKALVFSLITVDADGCWAVRIIES